MTGIRTVQGFALALLLLTGDAEAQGAHVMEGRIFDFPSSHPDFETRRGGPVVHGHVASELGEDGRPVWAGLPNAVFSSKDAFDQWYRDVPGLNVSQSFQVELVETPPRSRNYIFEVKDFFPIDGALLGNEKGQFRDAQDKPHNFHWTMRLAGEFSFLNGDDQFSFTGDDDLWVFFGGRLGIDLGGVHSPASQTITGAQLMELGLQTETSYPIDIFFAERQTTGSSFGITTNFDIRPPDPARVVGLVGASAGQRETTGQDVLRPALSLQPGEHIEPGRRYALASKQEGNTLILPENGNLSILGPDNVFRWGLNQVEGVDVTEISEVRASAASALEAVSDTGELIWAGSLGTGEDGIEVRNDQGSILWSERDKTNDGMPYRVVRAMVIEMPDVLRLTALSDGDRALAMTDDGRSLSARLGPAQPLRVINFTEDKIGLVAASGPKAGEYLIASEQGLAFEPLINRSGVFIVRAPLATIKTEHVSFEALAFPGMYLRSDSGGLKIGYASTAAEPAIREAATFRIQGVSQLENLK